MEMHSDIVFDLPKDTELLASNGNCVVQAFYRPNSILAVQGHPEFTAEFEDILIKSRKSAGILTTEIADEGLTRLNRRNDGLAIAQAFIKFINEN